MKEKFERGDLVCTADGILMIIIFKSYLKGWYFCESNFCTTFYIKTTELTLISKGEFTDGK